MNFIFIFKITSLSSHLESYRAMKALLKFLFLLALCTFSFAQNTTVSGRVLDGTGAVIPEASVRATAPGFDASTKTDALGAFTLTSLPEGSVKLEVMAKGFARTEQSLEVPFSGNAPVEIRLKPGTFRTDITVQGTRLVDSEETAARIPGSVHVIDEAELERSRVFNFSEALRKAPGINVRDEEGFGLRPNIGIRGLNPTRSSKLLLLEDGVPLAYAVYGDNASYYHPPVERFVGIEVLKGAGQILYGPVTVGGVVNYITPDAPKDFSGAVTLIGGNRNYFNGNLNMGGTFKGTGILVDFTRKQGDGARDNVRSGLNDATLKVSRTVGTKHSFTLKGNMYTEDSNVAYSGLRLSEWLVNPRSNVFKDDFFYGRRHGASLNHWYALNNNVVLSTTVYGAVFTRDWWRQSSNSGQRPNDSADPACGGMTNLNTTCGNEGRQRQYHTLGVEPHVKVNYSLFGSRSELDFGFRAHFEKQYRLQRNGSTPTARTGNAVESNIRREQAYSTFVQNRFSFGKLTITPGFRVEHVDFQRTNQLANAGVGVKGRTDLTQVVPGVGASYTFSKNFSLFGGAHRGFAPPRTEDVVSNTGGTVDLDPELSWNYEFGFRSKPWKGIRADATYFRMDYENQIVAASLAGGVGAALTNGGATLHQGFEFSGQVDTGIIRGSAHNVYFGAAYTWLPTAEFMGKRFSNISGFSTVSVTGNRLPYAPENTVTANIGYTHPKGLNVMFEAVAVGDQFGDDLNTVASTADGQRGLLPGYVTWNATANYKVEQWNSTLFLSVKNLADKLYVADRARGMLPGTPRLIQSGIKYTW